MKRAVGEVPGRACTTTSRSTRPTFVNESIREVIITLLIAIALVVVVIFLFLQDWRTTLIPAITIPVSLIGTFAFMKVLGFSINTLTLFGLTLATGLVVDDAIVVIENIARFIQEKKMSPLAGASAAMAEITARSSRPRSCCSPSSCRSRSSRERRASSTSSSR